MTGQASRPVMDWHYFEGQQAAKEAERAATEVWVQKQQTIPLRALGARCAFRGYVNRTTRRRTTPNTLNKNANRQVAEGSGTCTVVALLLRAPKLSFQIV